MIDKTTKQPIYVSTDGTAGPYIMVPLDQLDELCQLLDEHQVRYEVEEDAISLNGAPMIATVDLDRGADVIAITKFLDRLD